MLTSKERSKLRAMAHGLEPLFQVGKAGISDSLVEELSLLLENKELVKIQINRNTDVSGKDIINELAASVEAEPVSAIGNKVTLYRRSKKDNIEHIEF